MFPADNVWNTPIDTLPTHPMSDAWIASIGSAESIHMDFGSGEWDGGLIGIPFNIVAGSAVPKFDAEFYYPDESDPGPYPIPDNPSIEHGSDHHILVVDTETCLLYEIFDASFDGTMGWRLRRDLGPELKRPASRYMDICRCSRAANSAGFDPLR